MVHSGSQPGKRNPIDKALKTNLDTSPKSELISRAAPSVEAHHRSVGPDTGRNSGGKRIKKVNTYTFFNEKIYVLSYFPLNLELNCFVIKTFLKR